MVENVAPSGRANTATGSLFECPRRHDRLSWAGYSPRFDPEREGTDTWRNDETCSYCGSVKPEAFFAAVETGDYTGTDKGYKVYVNGHAKFYFQHLTVAERERVLDLVRDGKLDKLYVLPFFVKVVAE